MLAAPGNPVPVVAPSPREMMPPQSSVAMGGAVETVGFGLFDWIMPFMAASIILPLVVTVLVIGVVVWAVRRNSAAHEDPAVSELKGRLARGDIDPIEYEVRLRSLTRDRD